MRNPWIWIFVVIWFLHLAVGAGAGYAALRLWRARRNPFIWRTGLYLCAMVVDLFASILLVFMARDVRFSWKFTIVMFAAAVIEDMIRLPLIIYVLKGPEDEVDSRINGST